MFFQTATPDTTGYMIAGYAVAFIVMALYVASLYLRSRNLKQDMTMLEEMDKQPAAPVRANPPRQPRKSPTKPAVNKAAKTVTKKSSQN